MLLFFPAPWSAKAEITKPRVLRDLEGGTERREDKKRRKQKAHKSSRQSWPGKADNISAKLTGVQYKTKTKATVSSKTMDSKSKIQLKSEGRQKSQLFLLRNTPWPLHLVTK